MQPLLGKEPGDLLEFWSDTVKINRLLYWIYRRRVNDFAQMDDLPRSFREDVASHFTPGLRPPSSVSSSLDGSKKYLFEAGEKGFFEAVLLPDHRRSTLCISVQAGCRMGCSFCMTGKNGYRGNLTTAEILNQLFSLPEADMVNRIVFMGMGEPFDNYDFVLKSIRVLSASWGRAFGESNITVSTVGLLPQVKHFISDTRANLALSLHSPFPSERAAWIPAENKFPVADTLHFLRGIETGKRRRISVEYALIRNVNDTGRHLKALTDLLATGNFNLNLIPFNPVPGLEWMPPSAEEMKTFQHSLNQAGIHTTLRRSRGTDISAACGLLGSQAH